MPDLAWQDLQLGADDICEGPAGNPSCTPTTNYASASQTFPAPDLPCWPLVARIGSGPPFEVGTSARSPPQGRLYLGVNDGDFSDNSGQWTVTIKIGGVRRHRDLTTGPRTDNSRANATQPKLIMS